MTEKEHSTPKKNHYPAIIQDNLEPLYRHEILDPVKHKPSFDNGGEMKDFDADVFNNNGWYSGDLLFMFGCYRKDYEHLLFPIANALAEKGFRIHLIVYEKSSPNLAMLSKKINKIYYNTFVKEHNLYKRAASYFSGFYEKELASFTAISKLTISQKNKLYAFYKRYAFDKLLTDQLIALIKPKCIAGIHFILTPGCVESIKSASSPIFLLLLQHGLISAHKDKPHDFWGADLVVLWGHFFQELLNRKKEIPSSVILGNPKLEHVLTTVKAKKNNRKDSFQILYIFTGSPKEEFNISNVSLFLKSIRPLKHLKVLYKLHPNSKKSDCRFLIQKGLIKEREIITHTDLYELIVQSDLIIGDYSTAIFEAAALNRPVIQIYQNNYPEEYVRFPSVHSASELTSIITKMQTNPQFYQQWVERNKKQILELFHQIEGSIDRISAYLAQLLTGNSKLF
ncbi:CDP-glycerol glycerophosphotransferase family protein [Metabacillus sp. cB07]|uniref:CDP-glycerol glycerophosphotransferase family protein n=1 Tax=Metabacillus sp. cB07 TaxID=2806989 RepID=UPI001939D56D|nr:CDP-glycerol glycerophosphotransferase family protein [Metabacillus sp. cB07]